MPFNIKQIRREKKLDYKAKHQKNIDSEKIPNKKYIVKFWDLDNFVIYCMKNKNIYEQINSHIKKYNGFDLGLYLDIKRIEYGNNIIITTLGDIDKNNRDLIGFLIGIFDIDKNYCFNEHLMINPGYRKQGLGNLIVKQFSKYYFKRYRMPLYGLLLNNNPASLKTVKNSGYIIDLESCKETDRILVIKLTYDEFKNQKKILK